MIFAMMFGTIDVQVVSYVVKNFRTLAISISNTDLFKIGAN